MPSKLIDFVRVEQVYIGNFLKSQNINFYLMNEKVTNVISWYQVHHLLNK